MIAGFEAVSAGSIGIAGRDIHTLPPAKRNVAMAFEGYALYPPLTLRDNIAFALKSSQLEAGEVARRVDEVAKLLDIEHVLDRYPSSLSGGQQQRASLGRALVRDADLCLLDEPMGQLEPGLRAVLRARLKHYIKARGLTAILVTHDQTEANALADRIAVMEDGVLQQYGTPAALKDQPANLFVGTFIGEPPMNVLETSVSHDGEQFRFQLGGGASLQLPAADFAASVRGLLGAGELTLGLRPHSLRVAAGPEQSAAGAIGGTILSNQWLGDQTHVAVDAAGTTLVAVAHERVRSRVGDSVSLALSAADLHLFDAAAGHALAHGNKPA